MYKCKHNDCFYSDIVYDSGNGNIFTCCGYMLKTGESRSCPAESCNKYVPMKYRTIDLEV